MTTSSRSWLPSYIDSRITRRRFLKASAAGAGAAALLACGGGGDDGDAGGLDTSGNYRDPGGVWSAKNDWNLSDETKQAVRGGIYRGVLSDDQEGHFDAITLVSSQVPFSPHVLEMLMGRNRGPGIDPTSLAAGNPAGVLAESWEVGADGSSLTYTLRKGVKWQDVAPVSGREMDIDDWKTSFERHLELGVYRNAIGDILDRVEYPDDTHMVWKLKQPFAPIFDRIYNDKFAFPIQAKELNASSVLAEGSPIGTGYKILDSHQPAIHMQYRKHPEYWGGDPFIERWHQPIIPEYANRYAQFVTGNIIDFEPTARDITLLNGDAPQAVIVAEPIPDNYASRMRWGRMDPAAQVWADPRVRIAAKRSIEFEAIGKFLSNQEQLTKIGIDVELAPMTHLPRNPGYWLDPLKGELGGGLDDNYLFSIAEAKKLTAAAGFPDPIPMSYYVRLRDGEVPEADKLVMDSLAGAGTFALDIVRVASRAEHNKFRIEGRYDGLIPQSASSQDPDYFVMRDYHKGGRVGSRGLQNQAYPDAEIDRLGDAQRAAMDPVERFEILREFQRVAAGLMPSVPGRHQFTTFSFRWPWVRNLGFGTGIGSNGSIGSPPPGRPVNGAHLHWLDEEMPRRADG